MEKFRTFTKIIAAIAVLLAPLSQASALDAKKGIVTLDMNEEPRNMDPQKAQDTVAFMILGHVLEGLTRLDPRNRVIPGQAKSWEEISPTKYRFTLRDNIKWSDGKPVTADDFVFAWQHGIDPKTASLYAFILFPLKNAKAINEGKMKLNKLGVKAVNAKTLEVELERPTGYFLRLLSFGTYMPARRDFVKKMGAKYASGADKLIYNGPWTLAEWKHNSSMKLVKNPKYWNAKRIKINVIDMPYLIRDENTKFNMVKDGKYDMIRTMTKSLLPSAQKNRMNIKKYNAGTVWYMQFNVTRKVTGNKWIRRAISTAINRQQMVSNVVGIPGTKPIFGIIPDYMPGVKTTYGKEYKVRFKDGDMKKAKEYLAKGLKELGLKKMPEISLLINDSESHKKDAEYLQSFLDKNLGIKMKIDVQTFKVRLQKTSNKDYDLVKSGWGPDYLDAMTFADLFTSWNTNNDTGWANKDYDKNIDIAMNSTDQKTRLDAMNAAEKILIEEAPIASLYQSTRIYVINPQLTGVLRRTISPDPDFYYARIKPSVAKK